MRPAKKNADILKEKWLSIANHTANVHEWENNKVYHKCSHGTLSSEEERNKKWLPIGSHAHEALKEIVNDKNIVNDLPYLVQFEHSGEIEVYHSLYLMYCPKRISFSYEGMYARAQLAIMDHNFGIDRVQSKTKDGKPRYRTVFSKVASNWVAKKIMERKKKTFIDEILHLLRTPENMKGKRIQIESVPMNIATVPYPGKDEIIKAHKSRFLDKK